MLKPFCKQGVVLRKSPRSEAAVQELRDELRCSIRAWLARVDGQEPSDAEVEKHFAWASNEDEQLAAFPLMNGQDTEAALKRLTDRGLALGEDFVQTAADKVVGELPSWLRWEFPPAKGLPEHSVEPDPEAPDVWERSRPRLYGHYSEEMRAKGVPQTPERQ